MKKILLLLILAACMSAAGTIDEAKKLFYDKQYEEALIIFNEYQDIPESQYHLGKMYLDGLGVDQNQMLGVEYLHKSARSNNTWAMTELGNLFRNGNFIKKDISKAKNWFNKAIKAGDIFAYLDLGDMHYYDLKDYQQALENYISFEKYNTPPANIYCNIGYIYKKQNKHQKAYIYFEKAIKMGDEFALELLAKLEKPCNKKYMNINKKLFNNGYMPSGCNIASCYSNNNIPNLTNYIKSYDLANEIIMNNPNKDMFTCYNSLSYMYRKGYGVAKDIHKSIELKKILFKNNNLIKDLIAQDIARIYLEDIQDYTNAQKWYKVAYELSKDEKYLNKVSEYQAKIAKYTMDENTTREQKVFPILNNFNDISQVRAITGGKNITILSTSEKSINIYDDKTWKLKKELRAWRGRGLDGSVDNMVFDDTEGLLYFSGFKSTNNFKKNDIIQVFDIETGKIIKSIQNKKIGYSSYLSISKDGKYLIAINEPKDKFHIINTDTHTQQIYSSYPNKFITALIRKKDDDYLIYAIDSANYINIYSHKKKRLIQSREIEGIIRFSSDNYILVKKKNNQIDFLDYNLSAVKTLNLKKSLAFNSIDLSTDNKNLVLVGKNKIQIYNLDNKIITKTINSKYAIISAVIDDNILYIINSHNFIAYNLNTTTTSTKLFSENYSNIEKLYFNNMKLFLNMKNIKQRKVFDLNKLHLSNTNKKFIYQDKNNSLIDVKLKNNNTTLELYKKSKNELLTSIDLLWMKILNYKVINNEFIIITTNEINEMFIFNIEGDVVAKLSGFTSLQTNIIYSNNYLFTFGKDNIIHIWNLNNLNSINLNKTDKDLLKKIKEKMGKKSVYFTEDNNSDLILTEEDLISLYKSTTTSYIPSRKQVTFLFKTLLLKKETIYPIASLYIKDDDWIIYNKEGFFDSSPNGKNLIRYHLNQGFTKEAKIIENDQVFEKFYRPKLIKKILAKEKIDEKINIRSIILNIKPPEVTIIDKIMKDKKNLELRYKICDVGNGVSNTSLTLNGIMGNLQNSRGFTIVSRAPAKDKCTIYKNIITLEPGKNTISVKAFDREKIISNTSKKIVVYADYTIEEKPNLHLLTLAVSDYKDDAFKLKYPVSDVLAVQDKMIQQGKELFDNIFTYKLHDQNMTKKKLIKIFNKISKNAKINDVFIMYIAGHGITKEGIYYFLPYDITDTTTKELKKYAISVNDLSDKLADIVATKSLILLDTCGSGGFIDNSLSASAAIARLDHASKRNYIAASSSEEAALEGYKDRGVFTYVVLDAFEKASASDTELTVFGLGDKIDKDVRKISDKFHYEQKPEMSLRNNFPIGILK